MMRKSSVPEFLLWNYSVHLLFSEVQIFSFPSGCHATNEIHFEINDL